MTDESAPSVRRTKRWRRRACVALGVAVTLLVTGAVAQQVGTARDRARWQPDRLVDVGGHGLHVRCSGPDSDVTVVLEASSGGSSLDWAWVQRDLERDLRVCSYDRAGRGWSTGHTPASLADVSADLRSALGELDEPGPYVLVGHSLGGIYVRDFQQRHPDDVAGLVLVDASHPQERELLGEYGSTGRGIGLPRALTPVGLFRLYLAAGGDLGFESLPDDAAHELRAQWATSRHLRSIADEIAASGSLRAEAARDLRPIGDLPTVVLSADEELFDGWSVLQADLASVGTDVTARTIPGSSHMSLLWDPNHAAEVSSEVRTLADSVMPAAR